MKRRFHIALMGILLVFVRISVALGPEQQSPQVNSTASQPRQADSHYLRPATKNTPYKDRVIVFVHGLFGDAYSTWKYSPTVYWPELLLEEETFKDYDIYVAAYPTRTMTLDDMVSNLENRLADAAIFSKHREVVFVCHSMGGIVVQRLLLTHREYANRVSFIYFFATPQTGSELANLVNAMGNDPLLRPLIGAIGNTSLLQTLISGDQNIYLQNLESEWKAANFRIRRYCAYETRTYEGIIVVGRLSGTRNCDVSIAIDENHLGIVKPSGMNHDSYVALRNAIVHNGPQHAPLPTEQTQLRPERGRRAFKGLQSAPYVRRTDLFDSYVLFNSYDERVPFICANSMTALRMSACAEIRDISKRNLREGGPSISSLGATVLQHYVVLLLAMDENSGAQISYPGPPKTAKEVHVQVINTPEASAYSADHVLSNMPQIDRNFFPEWFRSAGLTLPRETQIHFLHFPPRIAQELYIARLERADCFTVDIHVTFLPAWNKGTLPEGYEIRVTPDPSAQVTTYRFQLQIYYRIYRNSGDSACNPEDYERWVNDLFARFRAFLEN